MSAFVSSTVLGTWRRIPTWAPLAVVFALVATAGIGPAAATDVCGSACNQTWTTAGSPYVLTCDVTVGTSCTLTIDADVEVLSDPGFGLEVYGTLDVNGIAGTPVSFASNAATPHALDWTGLVFLASSVGYLDHVVVSHADRAIDATASSTLTLDGVTAEQNRYGLYVYGTGPPTVTVTGSTFTGNTYYGVYLRGNPDPNVTITQSSLFGNPGGKDFYTTTYANPDTFVQLARDNWWGTADPQLIGPRIHDYRSSAGSPRVDWCHFLDGPPPGGVRAKDVHCPELVACDSSVTWDLTDKPYHVINDVRVCAGRTLTVGPGVEVWMSHTSPQPDFLIDGILDVNGTVGSPVLLISDDDTPQALDWPGLTFRGSSTGFLDHLTISHADRAIDASASSTLTLDGVTADQNRYGLYVYGAGPPTVTVTGSTFTGSTYYGVYLRGNPNPNVTITQSSLYGNPGGKDLYTTTYADPSTFVQLARDNWWGTADPQLIGPRIHDYRSSAGSPRVDWCHFLDGPPPGGVRAKDVHCPELVACDSSVTWDLTDKPYHVINDVKVCAGRTLTVGPGVEVWMSHTSPQPDFLIDGILDVNGTPGSPVLLTSDDDTPQALDWPGLTFRGSSTGYLDHLRISHADRAIDASASSTLTLDGVTADQNRYGLYVYGAGPPTVNVTGSTFTGNTYYGVYLRGNPNPNVTITQSSLFGNPGGKDLYTTTYADPSTFVQLARDNWWGTADPQLIGPRIHDYQSSAGSPRVDWCHFLDGPPPGGVRAMDVHCPEVVACDSSVTWDLNDKPYHVINNVVVCAGRTLTVGPGVEVWMSHTSPQPGFLIDGVLDVNGTVGSPVLLTSDDATPQALDWPGLSFRGSSTGYLDHLTISHADRAIDATGSSTLTLNGVTAQNSRYGLYVYGAGPPTVNVTGSTFTGNTYYGVYLRGNPNPDVTITQSSLFGNPGGKDLYTTTYADPDTFVQLARDNWWGTADPQLIGPRIHDYRSSANSPRVDWCHFLDGPPPGGVRAKDVHCPELIACDTPVTWDLTDKPYHIVNDVWVCPGQTLTIEAGVEAWVSHTSPQPDFLIDGILDVNGTDGTPVLLASDDDTPQALDWPGLTFRNSSTGYLDHLTISHADRAIDAAGSSTVTLDGVTAQDSRYGLYVYGAGPPTVDVTGSTFTGNTYYGVYLRGNPNPDVTITQSSLFGNPGGKDLYTTTYADPDTFVQLVRDNWWGTADPQLIGPRIHDHRSSAGSPRADWCHFLDGPPPGGVRAMDVHCPELVACDTSVTWDLTDKPYHIVNDVWVCPGQTLTIEPGVEAWVTHTTPQPDFLIDGVLDVNGTKEDPVLLISDDDTPQALDWLGLAFRDSSTGYLDHVEIAHADRAVDVAGSAIVALNGVTARDNRYGLYVYGTGPPTATVTHSTFTHNTYYGAYLRGNPNPDVAITRSSFFGNLGGRDFYATSYSDPATTIVWATDNWWGTTDPAVIDARIHDYADSTGSPHVYYRAFGDTCDYALGIDRDGDNLPDFLDNCPLSPNTSQSDGDGDGVGDACDPAPGTAPLASCDGFDDAADGYLDSDGDGWGDPCDHHPAQATSYPGAVELCDGRDNDGDVWLDFAERADDDGDLGLECGDCDDFEPLSNVCICELCDNLIDDDCDASTDASDSECQPQPICIVLVPGSDPSLTIAKDSCGGATLAGPFDVITGDLAQVQFDGLHVDLGNVTCIEGGLNWDRVGDSMLIPIARCVTEPEVFFLGKNSVDPDYGVASSGEWRDVMDPDPACLP